MSGHGAAPTIGELARGLLGLAVAVGVFLALRAADFVDTGGPLFALGFLVVAGSVAGSLAAFLRLPRLTGYLLAGILAGPQGFSLLSVVEVKALSLINALALALIALQAGAEMTLPMLTRTARSVTSSAVAQILLVVTGTAAAFYLGRSHIPFAASQGTMVVVALALVWGVISLTRSPAVTLAVLSETRARGPVADFALGNVVLLDVLVLPLFALALSFTRAQLLGDPFDVGSLAHLGNELFASVAAGVSFGLIIALLFVIFQRERTLVIIVLAYAGTALCGYLRYDTLLVFVIGGFLVMNLTRNGPALIDTSEKLAAAVMIVFFATAGAKLDVQALVQLWPVAATLFLLRVVLTLVATRLGHVIARDPPMVRRYGWLSLVSQAGVTIGLATIIADALPGIGPPFASLAIAVVGLNELVGAVLFKFALGRAGEIPAGSSDQPADSVDHSLPSASKS